MRHISKDLENVVARTRLESKNYKKDVANCVRLKKGNYSSSKYGHAIIRKELGDIYYNKCAYCESKIEPVSTPHVEHFRPVGKITDCNDSGYYWLGYEWSNLLLSCPSCNNSKSTKFPLNLNNHVVDHPVDGNDNPDFKQFDISNGYHVTERPLLINPEIWNPESLLYVNHLFELKPVKENIMAKTTIKELGLNRNALVLARQKVVDEVIERIEEQILCRYAIGLNDQQYEYQLNLIFKQIISRISPEAEYSLVGINMVERFEELVLDELYPEFRKEILEYFIKFLNNL